VARVFISLASNVDPASNIRASLRALREYLSILAISTVYQTPPLHRPEQDPYYNAVIEIATDLPPETLKFDILRPIEKQLGRRRQPDKFAPRTIDLDILLYGDIALSTDKLQLPDPDIASRPFLSIPLAELHPNLVIPGANRPIADLVPKKRPRDLRPLLKYTRSLREDLLHHE